MQGRNSIRHVIFLDGPIGVGKTTFGQYLAQEFAGDFIDGDDYAEAKLPWFASSLSTSRHILREILNALASKNIVFVAYPIRCINWIYFERHLSALNINPVLLGLQAHRESIADVSRNRRLSETELTRSREMTVQGYGSREFSNLFVQADAGNLHEVVQNAKAALREELIKLS
ncbi:shikimate kinase [Roseobacter weihaiensis]|uniref:shikimate kinase n=1 Tax=Roseobacter weihaiensis TaxID=2763262 RepID=UPI001D0B2609|nr:shikimate kinase [Roseobacter sp. H9]